MRGASLDDAAFSVCQREDNNESAGIDFARGRFHFANFQARYHTKQNVLWHAIQPSFSFVYCYAAMQMTRDGLANLLTLLRDDRNCGVFIDAVNQEVDRFGRSEISEHRIERGLDAKKERRR